MKHIIDSFSEWFRFAGRQFAHISFADVLDILILSSIFYLIYRFIRERRAARFVIGIAGLVLLYGISVVLGFHAIEYVGGLIFQIGILVLIILFQPEIRSALEGIGEGRFFKFKFTSKKEKENKEMLAMIDAVCEATSDLQRVKQGALIVIERTVKLGDIVRSGVELDANVNAYLLRNIFYPKAPLHDGAVIIRDRRVCAAGCFLPLTQDTDISRQMGTRHRAAIGMSEMSDAVIIVVSEETSRISMAYNGKITNDYNYQSMREELLRILLPSVLAKASKTQNGRNSAK